MMPGQKGLTMSAPPDQAAEHLARSTSVFHTALAYLGPQVVGLAGIGWYYDSLRAWAVDGPVLSCTVRVPLLVVAGVVAELAVLAAGTRLATR